MLELIRSVNSFLIKDFEKFGFILSKYDTSYI